MNQATTYLGPAMTRALPRQGAARWLVQIALLAVAVALMTLAAKTKMQIGPVPITLQTLVLPLIAATYGSRLGAAAMLAYLAAGFAGAPVFTNTPPALAGPGYFFGPTGGYLLMYPMAAFVIGWVAERKVGRNLAILFAAMLVGDALIFAGGVIWLAFFAILSSGASGMGLVKAWTVGAMPFLFADLIKQALAACLIVGTGWIARKS